MCFSAEASFTASAVLAAIGAMVYRSNKIPRLSMLALVPLLFAIQQFSEGVLWLNMPLDSPPTLIQTAAINVYTGFAYFFWPVYVPLCLLIAEPNLCRKKIIRICLAASLGLISYFTYIYLTSDSPIEVKVSNHSLDYNYRNTLFEGVYTAIVLIACFSSTLPGMKAFGILVVISILAAAYLYTATFVSAWCFFAAVISLFIFFIIRRCNRGL